MHEVIEGESDFRKSNTSGATTSEQHATPTDLDLPVDSLPEPTLTVAKLEGSPEHTMVTDDVNKEVSSSSESESAPDTNVPAVSYTHLRAHETEAESRMPSSA